MKTVLATVLLSVGLIAVVMVGAIGVDINSSTKAPNPTGSTARHYLQVQPGVTEINDLQTWEKYGYTSQTCFSSYCIQVPPVNFTIQTVLIVSPGQEGSSGYEFRVDNISTYSDRIVVGATLTTPGQDCVTLAVMTLPLQIVEIPKTNLPGILNMTTIQGPACPV